MKINELVLNVRVVVNGEDSSIWRVRMLARVAALLHIPLDVTIGETLINEWRIVPNNPAVFERELAHAINRHEERRAGALLS